MLLSSERLATCLGHLDEDGADGCQSARDHLVDDPRQVCHDRLPSRETGLGQAALWAICRLQFGDSAVALRGAVHAFGVDPDALHGREDMRDVFGHAW